MMPTWLAMFAVSELQLLTTPECLCFATKNTAWKPAAPPEYPARALHLFFTAETVGFVCKE